MKKATWLIVPLIICLCGPVSAEFYKYTDRDGNTRFTDDLSNVPEDQRPNVTSYGESESSPKPATAPVQNPAKQKSQSIQKPNKSIGSEAQGKQIQIKKEALDKEYQALMKERSELQEAEKKLKGRKATDAYNQKIKEHNDKIVQWEQNKNALNAEVESHNAKITEKARRAMDKK